MATGLGLEGNIIRGNMSGQFKPRSNTKLLQIIIKSRMYGQFCVHYVKA